ncbi:4096_t:CDS:2, partial [Funneliformis caledonium]
IQERNDATSVIKNNILYVLGGFSNGKAIPEILSLDLTNSININSPPWSQLKVPPLAFSSSGVVLGGLNNSFILVIGGVMRDPFSQDGIFGEQTLLEYDIKNNEWKRTAMKNAPDVNDRVQFKMLSNNDGIAYLHGGFFYNGTFLGDTYLFDTFLHTWEQLPTPKVPVTAYDFAPVLLNDGRLIIIGGFGPPVGNVQTPRLISKIEIFNTVNSTWSSQTVPQPNEMSDIRRSHTSTLLPNGDIVIIGGVNGIPNVVILKTASIQFQWKFQPFLVQNLH